MFNYVVPAIEEQPGLLRKILLSDVNVLGVVSPLRVAEIHHSSSLISVGSGAYNVVSFWIENELHALATGAGVVNVPGLETFDDPFVGFLQRMRIGDGPSLAFYAAGPSEQATKAAVYLLVTRWEYLRGRFGDRENFCVILKADTGDYRRHTILFEGGERATTVKAKSE
jgi:hypothetical protein